MKKLWGLLMGVALTAMLAMPAVADEMRARIAAVDVARNTVTVVEGGKDYTLTATGDTKFLNAKGDALASGIKSGDLKEGRRVIVNFDKKDNTLALTSLQLRR